ncbi:MAG: hypothetical protein WC333_01255 [Dehalococcoidia bacterium]|jgi:hypothetical protein
MNWKLKIEKKPNQRIVVKFEPLTEELLFTGEYKPHNREWVIFYQIWRSCWNTISPPNLPDATIINADGQVERKLITAEEIGEEILKTYNELQKKVDLYENLTEGFSAMKTIDEVEITE